MDMTTLTLTDTASRTRIGSVHFDLAQNFSHIPEDTRFQSLLSDMFDEYAQAGTKYTLAMSEYVAGESIDGKNFLDTLIASK